MRQKKKWGLCCIILLITVAFATGCYGKKSKSQEAVQTCEFLSEQTAEIEKGYLDENGYIQSDDMKALLEEVSSSAEVLFAEGKITDYAYKAGDTCVYMKIDDWLGFVYIPPLADTLSGSNDGKVEVCTIEPYSTEFGTERALLGSAVFFNKNPKLTAELLQKNFSEKCNYEKSYIDDEISIEMFLDLPKQSIILWEGHGGYNEEVGSFLGLGKRKLDAETLDVYNILVGSDALLVAQNGQYCVTSKFFEQMVAEDAYEGNLFYLNACSSLQDERLAKSLSDKGARCIVGNTQFIWTPYASSMMYRFFEGMTKQSDEGVYYRISEALNYAKQKEGKVDPINGGAVEAIFKDDFTFPDMLSGKMAPEKKEKVSTVEFEHILNEGEEYAIITGLDDSNQEVWTVTTEKYPQIKLTSIEEIGAYDDRYYYNEGGTVKALDMSDGTLLWQNSDFGGASIHSIIDDTGMLYLCGYYGPDFFAVNLEGSTLCRIESFDENYYWPCNIEKKENSIEVTLEGGTEGNLNDSVFSVSLVDYSYSMVHKNDNDMMELSAAQLKYVQEQLGVPMDLEVETTQGEPVYWEAGACWTIYVSIYQQNSIIAAANVNPENSELVKDIYQYNSTEIETSAVINETWLQEDVTDPLMFEFYEDGSVFYMPTVSREAEYTTKYKIEDDILTIDLVEIGATGVVPVSYKITYQDSKVYLELIDIDDDVDISRLYGWESIIPGWYVR